MSIIIEKVYLDQAHDPSIYPLASPPHVLSDLRYSVSLASDAINMQHTLYILYRNVEMAPVRVKASVLTSTWAKHSVHMTPWSTWTKVNDCCTIPVAFPYGVERILKIEFDIEHDISISFNESPALCAALERLEKNSGITTQFVLIAKQEGKDPYVVHSPMGPLDVLAVLNKVQEGVIKDTASLIGEL